MREWPGTWDNSWTLSWSTIQCMCVCVYMCVERGQSDSCSLSLSLSPRHLVSSHETGYSVILSAPANATQLRQLYLEHARPLVGQMTQSNHGNLYKHRPLLVAYYDVDWSRDGIKGEVTAQIFIFSFTHSLVQPHSTGMVSWPLWPTSSPSQLTLCLPLLMKRISLMISGNEEAAA